MTRLIATFCHVGYLPKAPGTWGTLAALPPGYLLHWLGGFPLLFLATLAAAALGWWAIRALEGDSPDPDRPEYVIDEVVGLWIALFPLSFGLWAMGAPPHLFPWPGWVGAVIAFRVFDIWKPWPIGWADRIKTPWGVMLDDILAGIWAALVILTAAAISHGWLA